MIKKLAVEKKIKKKSGYNLGGLVIISWKRIRNKTPSKKKPHLNDPAKMERYTNILKSSFFSACSIIVSKETKPQTKEEKKTFLNISKCFKKLIII